VVIQTTALFLFLLPFLAQQPKGERKRVDFGSTPATRVKLLRHSHPSVRRRAAMLLAHAPADEAIAGLLVALDDSQSSVRLAAASSLGSLGDERAVPFLARRAVVDPSPRVQAALLLALGMCGDSYVARHVAPFLEHPHRPVRAAAAAALGSLGDAGQREAMWAALRYAPHDPGFLVRSAILAAFARLGWKDDVRRAIVELEEMGAHRHWLARASIVAAIGAAGLKERAGWLHELITSEEDPRIIVAAAGALGRLGLTDDVYALLGHESSEVRRAALAALHEQGDPRVAARAAVMVTTDDNTDVRFEAAMILFASGHEKGNLYMVDALRSRDPNYWMAALVALEKKYSRSFGRDPEAWAEFFKSSGR